MADVEKEKKGIGAELVKLKNFLLGFGKSVRIGVFGDSVIRGVMLDSETGKFRTYKRRFEDARKNYGIMIENNGKIGYTSKLIVEQIKNLIDNENHPDFIFLEYGGNDCNFNWRDVSEHPDAEHSPYVTPEDFKDNYIEAIEYVRACGASVVIMIPPPIDAEKFLNYICKAGGFSRENILHWLGDVSMIYRWQEHYSDICKTIADETGCPVIDLRSAFIVRHDFPDLICEDGVHPTEAGHEIIDGEICKFFDNIIKK